MCITNRYYFIQAGVNYAFVEFADQRVAEQAIQDMNGRKIFSYVGIFFTCFIKLDSQVNVSVFQEIRANWAQQANNQTQKEDTASHFHVFVGDIAAEITDEALVQAFSVFGSMS